MAALSLVLHACNAQETEVSIVFHHAEGKEAYVCVPPGLYPTLPTDTLHSVSNDSVYRFTTTLQEPAFMQLRVEGNSPAAYLLLQPGQKVKLDYDLTAAQPCTFDGANAAGQAYLHQWRSHSNPYRYEWASKWTEAPLDTIPEKMEANINRLKQQDLAPLDTLLQSGQIDKGFYELARQDIELFYLSTLSRIARNGTRSAHGPAYARYWEELYRRYPVEQADIRSLWFYYYSTLYIRDFTVYKQQSEGMEPPQIKDEADLYKLLYQLHSEWTENDLMREVTLGNMLYMEGINNKRMSDALLPYFQQFEAAYPDNPYNPVFRQFAHEINQYQARIKGDFAPGTRFIQGRDKMKSLQDVFAPLKGKYIFVDCWFTTCGPCREQFAYAKPLEEFLKQSGIEMLYISIDPDSMQKDWENSIKYFELSGWHIRVPREVHEDMLKNYGIQLFPTYMLIDREGKILLRNTKYPSEQQALYKQIKEAISNINNK